MRFLPALLAIALAACVRRQEERPVIAFGDSLTEGYEVGPGDSYPERLARLAGRPILNRGVSGDTTADALARLKPDVLDEHPRLVLVCFGTNDMLRGLPADEQFANLRRVIAAIQATGARVILIGTEGYSVPGGVDYAERYRALAQETKVVYVPDLMRGVLGNPALMRDRIHPNAGGYEKIARRLLAEIGDQLRR